MTNTEASVQALQELGLNELEAAIYTFLLQEASATGYRVAQALNRPVANTYKALSALRAKGAVIVDDGESRICRAVPPSELFGQLERRLRGRCERAAEALAKLKPPPDDERVYTLQTWEQVMERATQMIARAEQVVLAIAFPAPLEELRPALEVAAARGVGILIKAYRPTEIRGAQIVLSNEPDFLLDNYPGQELDLVVDAQEHLVTLLDWDGKGVLQGIWSSSAFLSFVQFNGVYNEWDLTRLNRLILSGASPSEIGATINSRAYPLMETPGYRKLVEKKRILPAG